MRDLLNNDTHTVNVLNGNKKRTVHFDKLEPMTIIDLKKHSNYNVTINHLSYDRINTENIIKICSFNINGIRSFFNKSQMEYIIREKQDIIAFQETNAQQENFQKKQS